MRNEPEWLTQDKTKGNLHMDANRKIWDAAEINSPDPPDMNQSWARLQRAMAEADSQPARNWWAPRLVYSGLAAACIVVLAFVALRFVSDTTSEMLVTMQGERQFFQLLDRSGVNLNAASSLRVHGDFNKQNREVFLEGEAYFEVEKGEFPFLVRTGIADIKVLGTRFNVWSREELVTVRVSEGRVEVSVPQENGVAQTQILTAGQSLTCNRIGFLTAVEPVKPGGIAPWVQNDELYFYGDSIEAASREIARFWNVEIVVTRPSLPEESAAGLFRGDAKNMIDTMCRMNGRTYRYENGVYYID